LPGSFRPGHERFAPHVPENGRSGRDPIGYPTAKTRDLFRQDIRRWPDGL